MGAIETIQARQSIRGYKPDPVPREVIREILEIAARAPSVYNTQPWEVTIITGELLDKIRQANVDKDTSGVESKPEIPRQSYDGIYKERRVDTAKKVFALMNIPREDTAKRAWWQQQGSRYFDAPVALIVSIDKATDSELSLLDIGGFQQTVCLAAWDRGLATCIELRGVGYPEVIRELVKIPDSKRIIIAIAMGYPDWDFPANKLKTPRVSVDEFTTWLGFD
ncbi:nitroreductase [Chloroflexota bacterium]